jgi:hypothetical protein
VQVTASAAMTTDFMKVAGFPNINFGTSSTAAWGNVRLPVALALDNTRSMADNGNIQARRAAVAGSGGLIDQFTALANNPGDVYVSIVHSPRTAMSAPATTTSPGSTGPIGTRH